ncbi:hypothetical protein ACFPAF_20080 [Hymenobacter endophyticus]|uniref:DUF4890 domain-containing protein n=1 Tax=Hymenobacter endophyticus TaxID=3076335 RepID=A0ABU3TMW6_9BACT|nr:hypothetical protein [Hymenobacter endophyticus]MDU0372710.1 hypothetical protein [Hymenobacter endophyticus]
MKKLLIASFLLGALAAAPQARAQTEPVQKVKAKKDKAPAKTAEAGKPHGTSRGGRGPGNHLAEMTKELNLTPEQQTKVAALQQAQQQQLQAQRASNQGEDRAARQQQLQAQRAATDAKLKEVLTAEQYQQYQTRQQQRPQRTGPPAGGNR